jgi:hypothetical protein
MVSLRRHFPKCFIFVLFSALTIPVLFAQNASISGYVRDASSRETLIQATVLAQGTRIGAVTNTNGYYTLTKLNAGSYTLNVSFVGYQSVKKQVTLSANQHLVLDVELALDGATSDVVVESEREKEEERNVGVAQLSVSTITRLPSVLQADVFRSLQLLPGIKSSSDFSSGLYIRGGSPDQTLILLDRTTVYNPTHVFGFFSTFNPDAIKDVRLYKGGYPAEYGGRLGSVVDIYNKDGNRNETHGIVSLGMLSSRASIEGPYKKGSWMLAARRSTIEPLLAVMKKQFDGLPDQFYFYDANGKINFDFSQKDKVSASFYAGKDFVKIGLGEDSQTLITLKYGNLTGSANWTHIFSPQVFSNFTFTGSRYFSYPSGNFGATKFKRVNEVTEYSAKGDFEYIPNNEHQVQVGFWAGNLGIKLQDTFDVTTNTRLDAHNNYLAAYAQEQWRPNVHWDIKGGVRATTFGGNARIEPRLSADYTYSQNLRFQTAYGRYYQYLSLISNEAFSGFDQWVPADQGVKPSYGDQFLFGVKTKPFHGYNFDVETYYRTMKDLFDLDPFLPDPAGLSYSQLFRFGSGYAYGAEFFFEKAIGRFNGFVGYTYGRTWRRFPNVNEGKYYPPKYDRIHDVQATANYDLSKKWTATAVFVYATGQAYTEPLGRTRVDSPFGTGFAPIGGDVLTVGKLNASRLPAYHRLDIGFTRKGRFFKKGESELQLQVINVYSRRNVWFYQYNFDTNPIKREDTLQLPILPNVTYTVKI